MIVHAADYFIATASIFLKLKYRYDQRVTILAFSRSRSEMTTLSELSAKGIAKLLGAQVRVDFVKESGPKCRFVYGNLCTWDPESHSIVLAQFDVNADGGQDSRAAVDEPARLLLIPGDSIQNVQILEEPTSSSQIPAEESAGAQISDDVQPKKTTTTGISLPMVKNSAQLRTKFDRLFCPTVAKPESEYQQKVEAKEGAMEIGVGSPSTTAAATTSAAAEQPVRKRSPIETLKIFDDFVSAKRRRVIDVLNKNGIKFVEEPYTVAAAMGNIVREQNKEKKKPGRRSKRSKRPGGHSVEEGEAEEETAVTNTVLVLGPRGSLRIYPPYGKEQIVGNPASEVKRLTLMLTVADVFDN